jgi:hypothetical protein
MSMLGEPDEISGSIARECAAPFVDAARMNKCQNPLFDVTV